MGTAMFIKSALAMLITVGFAGGAVYYGTSDNGSKRNEVELRAPEKIAQRKGDKDVAKSDADDPAEVAIVEPVKPEQKSVIVPGSAPIPELEPEAVDDDEDFPDTLPANPETKPKAKPGAESLPEPEPRLDLAKIMPVLMQQTEKISAVEIKDQAYLDIVNFSVSQRQFKFADAAMQAIDQTELRDTARSQIAIGLALDGRADDAFAVIDAVEIDTLRDIMRLQVIEALILPGKLPPGLGRP